MRGDSRGARARRAGARGARGAPLGSAAEPGDTRCPRQATGAGAAGEESGEGMAPREGSANFAPGGRARGGSRLAGGLARCLKVVGDGGWGKGRPLETNGADLPPWLEERWLPGPKGLPRLWFVLLRFLRTLYRPDLPES